MKKHQKFSSRERDFLATWLAQKISKSECARRLKRPRETVVREIKRNGSWLADRDGNRMFVYIAISAEAKAQRRQFNCSHNKTELKNPDVYQYVTKHLRGGWSPEQIAGRLKEVDHPGDSHWQIAKETIYQWIYQQPKNEVGQYWYEYLRRKQQKRKKQQGRSVHRSQIPDRVSISQRPKEVNNRIEFGHWEGDSIEGIRLTKTGVHTEVERMSRKVAGTKVAGITSEAALLAQEWIFSQQPAVAVKSTTLDNGRETHLHYKLRNQFKMMTYHAHPYSSFERGTNEHGNWHLRYYFPKKTDFNKVEESELQAVIEEVNNRPRKIHHYLSANEVYYQLLKNTQV